jgi:hypothetical protein
MFVRFVVVRECTNSNILVSSKLSVKMNESRSVNKYNLQWHRKVLDKLGSQDL